ncbi:hypothetical protein M9458_022658, partial [Cirrhinus mrigala]
MDSDLDEEMEESDEPLAKREKAETEVIQVLQVGAMEDGSSAVVGLFAPDRRQSHRAHPQLDRNQHHPPLRQRGKHVRLGLNGRP